MPPLLFSVAQIDHSKNYHILPPPALNHVPDLRLIIAGRKKKYYAPKIQEDAKKENVTHRVFMTGTVHQGEKTSLLLQGHRLGFPALRQGLRITGGQALHFGKTVFGFNNNALTQA